jgi:hypothetical protein
MIMNYKIYENLNSENYATVLDKTEFDDIYNKYCSYHKINKLIFHRGDPKLHSPYLLMNGNKTMNQLQFDYNYITTEFVSSNLWKKKGWPLKKNSINITIGHEGVGTAGYFGRSNVFKVIPLNNTKMVQKQ